jgi:site-specific DNA recombinase
MTQRSSSELRPCNGQTLETVLVSRVSDPGPGKQDERSNSDQQAMLGHWLANQYTEPTNITIVGGSGAGEWLEREEYLQLLEMISTGRYDLVLTEDLGRILRRIHAHLFAEYCVDNGTRLIALNDHVDTADEGWQDRSIFSAWHHERSNRDTSDRIKRTHRNRFDQGGCAAFPIFGIIKPPGSKSDAEWHKDPAAEPIYQEWFERLDAGALYADIADWLNSQSVSTGPFARQEAWDCRMVGRVSRNVLLKGYRRRNVRKTRRNAKGKYISIKADPSELRLRHVPHLAFFEQSYYDRIMAKVDARNGKYRRKGTNGRDERANVPKKRTRFPGQQVFCGTCGRNYVFGAHGQKDHLMCDGARDYVCWNGASVDGPLASEKILAAVFAEISSLTGFDSTFLDLVNAEADRLDSARYEKVSTLTREIQQLDRVIENFVRFVSAGDTSQRVRDEIQRNEALHQAKRFELEELQASPSGAITIPSIEQIRQMADECFRSASSDDFEFSRLMQRLIPKIVVFPMRLCDGGRVVLRAKFRLKLARLLPDIRHSEVLDEPLEKILTVDLFDPPQREQIRTMVALELTKPKQQRLNQRQLAKSLGVTQPAVQCAAALQRKMDVLGITDPYLSVSEPPDDDSKLRRHRHPRYKFSPLPDAGEF